MSEDYPNTYWLEEDEEIAICPACNGGGETYYGQQCSACEGTGNIRASELIAPPKLYDISEIKIIDPE